MHFRKVLWILALVCVIASPAIAHKYTGKTAPFPMNNGVDTRDYFEGFEGAWPPDGWTAMSNSGHADIEAWYQGTNAYEGAYAATCEWDPDLIPQDNVLSFMHTVTVGEDHLNFWISGSAYWSANYDCTVEVNGDVLYSWAANVVDDWVFVLVDVDLEAYLDQTVEIAFRYAGMDGAAIYLDSVGLNEGYEPPPPPEPPVNDTCDGALSSYDFELPPGGFTFMTDNTLANPDYPLASGSCTGYSASGNDVVYYVCLDQGDVLDVSMQCGFDASLYIIADCSDPFGSCLAGADATISEGLEEILGFVAPYDGVFFVIVSAYSSGIGPIEVYGTNYGDGCDVATEDATFDGLKSLYR